MYAAEQIVAGRRTDLFSPVHSGPLPLMGRVCVLHPLNDLNPKDCTLRVGSLSSQEQCSPETQFEQVSGVQ